MNYLEMSFDEIKKLKLQNEALDYKLQNDYLIAEKHHEDNYINDENFELMCRKLGVIEHVRKRFEKYTNWSDQSIFDHFEKLELKYGEKK